VSFCGRIRAHRDLDKDIFAGAFGRNGGQRVKVHFSRNVCLGYSVFVSFSLNNLPVRFVELGSTWICCLRCYQRFVTFHYLFPLCIVLRIYFDTVLSKALFVICLFLNLSLFCFAVSTVTL